MNLLIHDFAGHPFAADLSRVLARRGHEVTHGYCGGVTTGRGSLTALPDDPATLRFVDVSHSPFERYSPIGRLRSEAAYGRAVAALVRTLRPDVVLSANCPLLAQALLWRSARRVGARRIYWLQDFLGRGTRRILADRSAVLAQTFGRAWERLETALLHSSDAVVAISDDFLPELVARGVSAPTHVIENWTPLHEVTVRPKDTPWSREHDLADRPVALYSGTLGLKHDPEHLVAAAQALDGSRGLVLVVTEGIGRQRLEERKAALGLDRLRLLDYVDYDDLPDLLGAADVCLVLLEAGAGAFSAPSKVLTYLAAGRPTVGAMPADNLASRTVRAAGAGVVVAPGDHTGFAGAVVELLEHPEVAAEMGRCGRGYAERAFDAERIAERMETILTQS
jgi:glycosyltransferase involved in cell wall biosynthesis